MRAAAPWVLALSLAGCAAAPAKTPRLTYWSDRQDRAALGTLVHGLLASRSYDRLDNLADSLQRTDSRFDDGASRLSSYFFFGARTISDRSNAAQWQKHLDILREWQDARPRSAHAPVALAAALIGRAWAARGGGWAKDVSPNGWRGFEDDLREARQVLDHGPVDSKSTPVWYEDMMEVMLGLGVDRKTYDAIYFEAVARFPTYEGFHLERSFYLLPRWYGRPGDWERAAAESAPGLPDSLRDETYARIVVFESAYETDLFRVSRGLDWNRLSHGLEVWQRRYPASPEPTSALARFAYQTGRVKVAREAFRRLGDNVHIDIWPVPAEFIEARRNVLAG